MIRFAFVLLLIICIQGCEEQEPKPNQVESDTQKPAATINSNAWIVDTHVHFKGAEQIEVESVGSKLSPKNTMGKVNQPKDYQVLADRFKIRSAIVVEAVSHDHSQFNDSLLSQAKESDLICGYIARGDLKSAQFQKRYQRYRKSGYLKGFRFRREELSDCLSDPQALKNLELLERDAMVVDLLVSLPHADDVVQLAKKFPQLKIVLNHCFQPKLKDGRLNPEWKSAVTEFSRQKNVYCKLSNILESSSTPAFSAAPTNRETYQGVLEHCYESFGEDRVLFGSNWPVCTHYGSVDDEVGIVTEFLRSKGDLVWKKAMRDNAIKVYNIDAQLVR